MCLGLDIWVPQILKSGILQANRGNDLFKVIDDRAALQVSPALICKNKVERVIPCWPHRKHPLHLRYLLSFQNPDDAGGKVWTLNFRQLEMVCRMVAPIFWCFDYIKRTFVKGDFTQKMKSPINWNLQRQS